MTLIVRMRIDVSVSAAVLKSPIWVVSPFARMMIMFGSWRDVGYLGSLGKGVEEHDPYGFEWRVAAGLDLSREQWLTSILARPQIL